MEKDGTLASLFRESVTPAIFAIRAVENEQPEGTILSRPIYSDWYAYLIRRE